MRDYRNTVTDRIKQVNHKKSITLTLKQESKIKYECSNYTSYTKYFAGRILRIVQVASFIGFWLNEQVISILNFSLVWVSGVFSFFPGKIFERCGQNVTEETNSILLFVNQIYIFIETVFKWWHPSKAMMQ